MKLLNITTTYILILLFTALSLWSVFFYYSITKAFYENIDEFLNKREFEIIQGIKTNSGFPNQSSLKTDFKIEPVTLESYHTLPISFTDLQLPEPFEKEFEPYRQLSTKFTQSGKYYKLTIVASLLDKEEIIDTIIKNVICLFLLILFLLVILNRILLQRLWKPFYLSLSTLKKYRLDKDVPIYFETTNINEFKELNKAVFTLIKKNNLVFQNQKQFIENASHEIQTPLARALAKIEHFIQRKELSDETIQTIVSINGDLEKLSGLNKSLLLLSKIENEQFHEIQEINIGELIDKIDNEFEDFILFKEVNLALEVKDMILASLNPFLAEILFRNLIKNAIYHNVTKGFIKIKIDSNIVTIVNTGNEYEGNTDLLFNRFVKNTDRKDSLGLGLAIAKTICNIYGLQISYTINKNIHTVTICF